MTEYADKQGGYEGPGLYEHYNGGTYRVLGVAQEECFGDVRHSNSLMVIYHREGEPDAWWARSLSDFDYWVTPNSVVRGSIDQQAPRFRLIQKEPNMTFEENHQNAGLAHEQLVQSLRETEKDEEDKQVTVIVDGLGKFFLGIWNEMFRRPRPGR